MAVGSHLEISSYFSNNFGCGLTSILKTISKNLNTFIAATGYCILNVQKALNKISIALTRPSLISM